MKVLLIVGLITFLVCVQGIMAMQPAPELPPFLVPSTPGFIPAAVTAQAVFKATLGIAPTGIPTPIQVDPLPVIPVFVIREWTPETSPALQVMVWFFQLLANESASNF